MFSNSESSSTSSSSPSSPSSTPVRRPSSHSAGTRDPEENDRARGSDGAPGGPRRITRTPGGPDSPPRPPRAASAYTLLLAYAWPGSPALGLVLLVLALVRVAVVVAVAVSLTTTSEAGPVRPVLIASPTESSWSLRFKCDLPSTLLDLLGAAGCCWTFDSAGPSTLLDLLRLCCDLPSTVLDLRLRWIFSDGQNGPKRAQDAPAGSQNKAERYGYVIGRLWGQPTGKLKQPKRTQHFQ